MKIVYFILGLLFVSFAAVQYNDPDPYIWGSYYLFIAILCFLEALKRYYSLLVWAALILTLGWAAFYVPDMLEYFQQGAPNIAGQMKAETPYIENMREFLGLVICATVVGSILYRNTKRK